MERIAPAGDVYQAGTLSGNPLAVAAGLATLRAARRDRLRASSRERPSCSPTACATRSAPAAGSAARTSSACPGLLTVFFRRDRVRDYADAAACDRDAYAAWCRELLARGVYPPASQFEAWFPSLAHDEAARRAHASRRPPTAFAAIARDGARERRRPQLADALRAEGGLLADRAAADAEPPPTSRCSRRCPPAPTRCTLAAVREGYLLHYGEGRVVDAPTTPTWRCSAATASTRSRSPSWPRWATSTRSPRWPT